VRRNEDRHLISAARRRKRVASALRSTIPGGDAVDHPEDDLDETELIARARGGDRDAFAGLVRIHQGRLRVWAARFVRNADDAYDIVQDAFLVAWRERDRFLPGAAFGPWIRGICRNVICAHLRRTRGERARCHAADDAIAELAASDAEEFATDEDEVTALRGCLDDLPPPHQRLLLLRYAEGLSVRDLEQRTGKRGPALTMMLTRIRRALEQCMHGRLRDVRA